MCADYLTITINYKLHKLMRAHAHIYYIMYKSIRRYQ